MKYCNIEIGILFIFTIFAICHGKGRSSSSSSSSGSRSSSKSSSSSSSGSSYPKQQYRPASQSSHNYGQPSHNYGQPSHNFAQPSHNYGQPSNNFAQPSPNFAQPSHNYGQPSPNYAQPSHNYGQPSQNFAQPSPNFAQPSHNYGQPSFNYGSQPSHNYGQPATFGSSNPVMTKPKKASKAKVIVGAAAGAYAAHQANKKVKKIFKKPKISGGGGGIRINRPRTSEIIFLAQVSPNEWGSRPITQANIRGRAETNKIIVHHTTFNDCYNMSDCVNVLKQVEARNMDVLGYPNIGYNFMVGGDGRIYVGLGWHQYSTITNTTYDARALQVAFIGDFSVYRPNDKQLTAFRALVRYADKKDYIKHYRIHAHRDLACTTCPGDALYIKLKELRRYEPLLDQTTLCLSNVNQSSLVPIVSANETNPIMQNITLLNI